MNAKLMITKRKRGEDGHKTLSIRVREDIIKRLDTLLHRGTKCGTIG